tara:strand:+ start:364 stop:1413 length:1050 start_codon:yes stop_codon:yes gene_type:complete
MLDNKKGKVIKYISIILILGFFVIENVDALSIKQMLPSPECCPDLEFECDEERCPKNKCYGDINCFKRRGNDNVACLLKNHQQFIDFYLESEEYHDIVNYPGVYIRNLTTQFAGGCGVYLNMDIFIDTALNKFIYPDSRFINVQNGKKIISEKQVNMSATLEAINYLENNEKVKLWIENYHTGSPINVWSYRNSDFSFQIGKEEYRSINKNRFRYKYDFHEKVGRVEDYIVYSDKLPEYEEIQLALSNGEIQEYLKSYEVDRVSVKNLNDYAYARNITNVRFFSVNGSSITAVVNMTSKNIKISRPRPYVPRIRPGKKSIVLWYVIILLVVIAAGIFIIAHEKKKQRYT